MNLGSQAACRHVYKILSYFYHFFLALYGARGYNIHMKMTRQHFQAQADLCADIIVDLDKSMNGLTLGHIDSIIESFCDMCGRSNPKFDRLRFSLWVTNNIKGISNNS